MLEVTTNARLVDYATLEDRGALMASVQRSELESALHAGRWPDLWVEVTDGEDTRKATIELPPETFENVLESWPGDEVMFAFDADDLAALFDPDVEAHGFKTALAVAVVAGAIAAPASLAASPQATGAANPQVSPAAAAQVTAQVSNPATAAQVTAAAARAQASNPAVTAQISKVAAKAQLASTYRLKAAGISQLRKR
jgi:hypothetical protein